MWQRLGFLVFVVPVVGTIASPAPAQVHMVLIDRPSVKPGEKVTATCVCGRPFTGARIDAQKPEEAAAYPPNALLNTVDLLDRLEKVTVTGAGKKSAIGYQCTFEPKEPGDYVLAFNFPPLWREKEKRFFQDAVRVDVHVRKELGWANAPPGPFTFVPMTRPYGLRERSLFQARLIHEKPARQHLVELEKCSAQPPSDLPDEEFITTRFLTDDRGVASCTLHEKGWWVLSAEQTQMPMTVPPMLKRGDKGYPVIRRAVLLVFVAGAPAQGGD